MTVIAIGGICLFLMVGFGLVVFYIGFRGLWQEGRPSGFRVKGLPNHWLDWTPPDQKP